MAKLNMKNRGSKLNPFDKLRINGKQGRTIKIITISFFMLLGFFGSAGWAEAAVTINVDTSVQHQTILGLGGNGGYGALWSAGGEQMVTEVVQDTNSRFVRWAIGYNLTQSASVDEYLAKIQASGSGWAAWNYAQKLNTLGAEPLFTIWSFPNWMMDASNNLQAASLQDAANFWTALIIYARNDKGIQFRFFELSNEPDGNWDTYVAPAAYWNLVNLISAELDSRNIPVKIVGPGVAFMSRLNNYLNAMPATVPSRFGMVSTHAWDTYADPGFVNNYMTDAVNILKSKGINNMPFIITEYGTKYYGNADTYADPSPTDKPEYALYVCAMTHHYLSSTDAVVSTLIWDLYESSCNSKVWGLRRCVDKNWSPRPHNFALQVSYRFIPPGSVRVNANTQNDPSGNILVTSYSYSTGLVSVVINQGTVAQDVVFNVPGGYSSQKTITTWQQANALSITNSVSSSQTLSLPPKSVTAVQWTTSADNQTPTVPTNLIATAVSSSQINLSWTASTDNVGVAGYKIYRCTGAGCTPSAQIGTSAVNSFSDTGLSSSTTYVYKVVAYDAAGNTAQSPQASATTQADTPKHYVRSGATGANNGTDWTNAWTSLPATLQRDHTYYIADGSYGGYTFDDAADGSKYIYIKKATVASHGTETGWSSSYGDGQATFYSGGAVFEVNMKYLSIDGATGSGTSGYGIVLQTSGTKEFDSAIVSYNGATQSYLKINHIELSCPTPGNSVENRCFDDFTWASTNQLIQNSYIHGGLVGVTLTSQNPSEHYSTIDHTYLKDIAFVPHSEMIQLANTKNVVISNNVFENCLWVCTTYIEPQQNGGPVPTGIYIFGNVFRATSSEEGTTNPSVISMTSGEVMSNVHIYNNTIYGLHPPENGTYQDTGIGANSSGNPSTGVIVQNNLWQSNSYGPGFDGVTTQDHNILNTGEATFVNAASGDFRLGQATSSGVSLPAPYNVDPDGVTRGSDGVWDIGAYEFGGVPASCPNCGNNLCDCGETNATCSGDCPVSAPTPTPAPAPTPCTATCSTYGFVCGIQNICGVQTNCGSCISPNTCYL
ncbi:MAG: fibronectin type III domain-containing protein, partial [bacterium]